MSERSEYPHGCFCWVDLVAKDPEKSKRFYTGLFGWEADDEDAGASGVYTLFQKDGKNVCAQFEMSPQMAAQGVPSHWQTYVSVENLDESLVRAAEKGASVIAGPLDVSAAGRMAMIQDPVGAQIALWQPGIHAGAEVVNETHTWCWSELQTRDIATALRFYTGLFGWGAKVSEASAGGYTSFLLQGREIGGMLEIQPEWGSQFPTVWSVYFTVDDLAEAKSRAQELSGRAITPPMEASGVGVFQVFQDPQGAHFTLIEMADGVTPE
jgi:predicted enzyme related to lactoylglutathione lyase